MRELLGMRDQAASSMQDLPDRSAGARERNLCGLQRFRHEEGSRAGLEAQAPASSSPAEQGASPQCAG